MSNSYLKQSLSWKEVPPSIFMDHENKKTQQKATNKIFLLSSGKVTLLPSRSKRPRFSKETHVWLNSNFIHRGRLSYTHKWYQSVKSDCCPFTVKFSSFSKSLISWSFSVPLEWGSVAVLSFRGSARINYTVSPSNYSKLWGILVLVLLKPSHV